MIRNYLTVAIRNLRRGRIYSAINLLGLAIGTAACLLIILFVMDEYSFDRFHDRADDIYRVWVKEHYQGDIFFNTVTPFVLGRTLRDNVPDLEDVMRYLTINSNARQASLTDQETVHLAEPNFFYFFDFEVLHGSKANFLNEPHSVVLTESASKKYFGTGVPLGKSLALQIGGEWTDFEVTGIVVDPPANASHQFNIVIPYENVKTFTSEGGRNSWTVVFPETYVMLGADTDLVALQEKITSLVDEKVADIYQPGEYEVGLQPLVDIHLNAEMPQGVVTVSDRKYPQILSLIALLILILACINFTSLAIGRSVTRAKEVAMRKVSGAGRQQVMMQFWTESIMTAFFAMLVGVLLTTVLLPSFNLLTGKSLVLTFSMKYLVVVLGLAGITGLIAGFYPSLILSRLTPLSALNSQAKNKTSKHSILRWLVGTQYFLSIILIVATLVMQDQIQFLQNKNLGFDQEQIVVVPYQVSGQRLSQMWTEVQRIETRLRSDLNGRSDIKDIVTSSHTIGTPGWMQLGFNDQEADRFRHFMAQQISANYLSVMDIDVKEGRGFLNEEGSDRKAAIINEAMVREFQIEDPIGKTLPGPFSEYQIVGLTDDFQYASLHNLVEPLVMVKDYIPLFQAAPDMVSRDGPNPKFSFKVHSSDMASTLNALRSSWMEVTPNVPFNYTFLDDNINQQYLTEARLGKIVGLSTVLAMIIAGLGLFAIALLTTVQRKKEIGVRKVLGASTWNIVLLLSKHFSLIVVVSSILAIPVGWWIMSKWLDDFAYGITLGPSIFILAALVAIILAWVSVGTQTVLAAQRNPVESIRE